MDEDCYIEKELVCLAGPSIGGRAKRRLTSRD